jgi:hypothetical protein
MVVALPEQTKKKIRLLALDMKQTIELIEEEGITFAVHPRPRNKYDDMTYPIKFFDYISWLLPILTDRHEPLVDVLGEDYRLYCDLDNTDDVVKKIITEFENGNYSELLRQLKGLCDENLYENRVEKIMNTVRTENKETAS